MGSEGRPADIFGEAAAPRTLYDDGTRLEVLYPGFEIQLKGEELEGDFLNLTSPLPKAFVLVRADDGTPRPAACPSAMPVARVDGRERDRRRRTAAADLHAWVGEFVERYYRPRPKFKRARK